MIHEQLLSNRLGMIIRMQVQEFSLERIARRKYYGATWQDKVKIDWPMEDRKLSSIAAKQTIKDMEQVKNKRIILMTHIVTHPRFAVPMPHRIFDYFNALLGRLILIRFTSNMIFDIALWDMFI